MREPREPSDMHCCSLGLFCQLLYIWRKIAQFQYSSIGMEAMSENLTLIGHKSIEDRRLRMSIRWPMRFPLEQQHSGNVLDWMSLEKVWYRGWLRLHREIHLASLPRYLLTKTEWILALCVERSLQIAYWLATLEPHLVSFLQSQDRRHPQFNYRHREPSQCSKNTALL